MRPLVVLLTLVTVGWLILGYVLSAMFLGPVSRSMALVWLGPPVIVLFLASEWWRQNQDRRQVERRIRALRR